MLLLCGIVVPALLLLLGFIVVPAILFLFGGIVVPALLLLLGFIVVPAMLFLFSGIVVPAMALFSKQIEVCGAAWAEAQWCYGLSEVMIVVVRLWAVWVSFQNGNYGLWEVMMAWCWEGGVGRTYDCMELWSCTWGSVFTVRWRLVPYGVGIYIYIYICVQGRRWSVAEGVWPRGEGGWERWEKKVVGYVSFVG